ncbi:MAG: hypothetical protein ACTSUE_14490 [Promethearchaeota archaeon]
MAKISKLPEEGDAVEILVNIPEYHLERGMKGKILVCYDTYSMMDDGNDFEVFFDDIGTSVILEESQFKLI